MTWCENLSIQRWFFFVVMLNRPNLATGDRKRAATITQSSWGARRTKVRT
jgi:hypothetical protein